MTAQVRDHHDERAIAFFGTWMVVGLFLDGWAHQAEKPETFFSPWHFILYSGFGAAVAYFTFRERILKKRTEGDRLTIAGLVVFIVGAVGDGIWHEIFGIEVDIEALLSPTHLALMIGGLLMLGIAYRKQSQESPRAERADYSLVVTMTLGAAVTMFFTQYFNAFEYDGVWQTRGGNEFWEIHAIGSVFVMNAIMLGLVFLIVRDWKPPRWTFTVVFGALAAGMVLLHGRRGPMLNIVAAALAGFITDLLVMRLRPSRVRVSRARVFSALVPLALWGLWFASLHLQQGVHWAAELWTGTVVLSVVEGVGLGLLAFPIRATEPPQPRSDEGTRRPIETAT
jgi:hypothetical protein